MRGLVEWAVRFRLLVLGIAAATLLFGFLQLPNVPVDAAPEFTPPYVEVQTEALGLSAEEVEQLITVPLEADLLNGVPWLESITSESVQGLSSIVLTFEPGTDLLRARQVVAERLTQAHALPNVSKPPAMVQPVASTSRVLMIGLTSEELSLIDMSVLARWTIRPRLLGVPGVAEVSIFGERERQLQVLVDPERLAAHGVPLEQVVKTAGNALWVSPLSFLEASTPGTGGFIDTPNQRLGVQHILPITSADDLARIALEPDDAATAPDAPPLRLGDVADVVEDHQPLIGDASLASGPGLVLVVEKFPGADTLAVTRGIDEALEALGPGLAGITIDPTVFRAAASLEDAIGTVGLALLIGVGLVAVALGVLLYSWRGLVVAMTSIVVSLATAAIVMHLLGSTVNTMVVAGLLLALIVLIDDAVSGTAGLASRIQHRRRGENRKSPISLVVIAILEQRTSLVYSTLIILAVAVPAALVPGPTGVFLGPLIGAYVIAILVSTVVALTVSVALAAALAPTGNVHRESRLLEGLRRRYRSAVRRLVKRERPALITVGAVSAAAVLLLMVAMVPRLDGPITPTFRHRDVLVQLDAAPGTSRIEMNRLMAEAGGRVSTIPGVLNVGSHVGRAVMSDQVVGINSGQLWITVDPAADYAATLRAIGDVVDAYPGQFSQAISYPDQRIDRVLGESGDDLVVRVYGQDLEVLRQEAEEVRAAIAGIDGVRAPVIEAQVHEPTLTVEIDLAAAQSHGIKPGDIRREATTLLSGIGVGALFEEQKVFDVVVWGVPEVRESVASVRQLLLESPDGEHVTLEEVADVSTQPAPSVIRRDGVFRYVDVVATVDGRDLGAVVEEVRARTRALEFPLEYRAEVLDTATARRDDFISWLGIVGAAAITTFLLLQAAFNSWRLAAIVFATLPIALVGGVLPVLASGDLGLGAIAGLIGVLAVATRHAVSLIRHYQSLEPTHAHGSAAALIERGAQERLGPTLITGVATVLGVAPFVALGNLPGLETIGPMAAVVLGGVATSTLVTLFVLPTVYPPPGPRTEPELVAVEVHVPVTAEARIERVR